MFRLPRLLNNTALVDGNGKPTPTFTIWWQSVVQQIEKAIGAIVDLTGIQDQFEQALQEAQAATAAAQQAADNAQATTDAAKREAALQGSYIVPDSVLSASPTTITVAAHTRMYADGTSANITVGTVAATASGDTDYVSYSDPNRAGGSVTFIASTTVPVQTGNTHVVGAVVIPAIGTQAGGRGPLRPGYVEP